MTTKTTKRFPGEVVKLTRDCELGRQGERAVVVKLEPYEFGAHMTLCFFDRVPDQRRATTGADYLYLEQC